MAKINEVQDIIVEALSANLTAHSYTEVYGGSAGCNITINGTGVLIAGSSSIFINVRRVSGGGGCYLLGTNKDVYAGSPYLGGSLG